MNGLNAIMNWETGQIVLLVIAAIVLLAAGPLLSGARYIPNTRVGIVERLWSSHGSVPHGALIVLGEQAGYQADVLRGGLHFKLWKWQYRIHKVPLTTIAQGKIGYVVARDGTPLPPEQTLARVVPCNYYQDTRAFLRGDGSRESRGQRGRQRAVLREGTYAINLAQFVVITEDKVLRLAFGDRQEESMLDRWRQQLIEVGGFDPVVVGNSSSHPVEKWTAAEAAEEHQPDEYKTGLSKGDNLAIITVHDGPSLLPGQIIAPLVAPEAGDLHYHNNYQDIEAFLAANGRRGRQLAPLTDGTYFINRWFASVELIPKTVVPIGHVGVVVSYYGKVGEDMSGLGFRHGERVAEGSRGVQSKTLCPGKYAFNTYAGRLHLVPTTNFVLHWITGRSETHRYDESLKSIDLVTADAYEPVLPLSVVVHLDYEKAPAVVQRFGDVKKLITQTLDPLLSAYFRDIAHKKTMLQLLHERDDIQREAKTELRARFAEFDIELVDVLIGKPETKESSGEIETLLQQLRLRQLSKEQIDTYEHQSAAAEKLKLLRMAVAQADKQTELSNSEVEIRITENRGEAAVVDAQKRARQTIVTAEADAHNRVLAAEAEGKSMKLLGEGQSQRLLLEGEAEAAVLQKKITPYKDPRLFALSVITRNLSQSKQPLVPERLFVNGGSDGSDGSNPNQGLLGTLIGLLVGERVGLTPSDSLHENLNGAEDPPVDLSRTAMSSRSPSNR